MHKNSCRLIALIILFFSAVAFTAAAANNEVAQKHSKLAEETLNYKVMFKWGLINKQAGSATLTLRHGKDNYDAKLTAHSAPWADRIFCVRDTLIGRMTYADFSPLFYEKIAHEGNDYKHDTVLYDYSLYPAKTMANCTRKEFRKGEKRKDEKRAMESERQALDMLTSFYFMRTLPFNKWVKGQTQVADIFSGKQKEELSIVYDGIEKIKIDDVEYNTYHITFKFTSGGGKKTSDDMEAWISADSARIPLKLEGKLPIGKVHCLYIPD